MKVVNTNNKFFKQTSIVLSIATLSVLAGGMSAGAQAANSNAKDAEVLTSASALKNQPSNNLVAQTQQTYPSTQPTNSSTQQTYPSTQPIDPNTQPTYPSTQPTTPNQPTYPSTQPTDPNTQQTYPTTEPTYPDTQSPTTTPETTPSEPTSREIEPGRANRGGSSYIGIGGNIGLSGGETAIGLGNFTVISKVGITNTVSARPSVLVGDDTAILIPVTYDFNLRSTGVDAEAISTFAPYIGAGLAITTGDNSDVGPMLTAGVDVPIANQFTANAGVNVGFLDDTSVGLVLGVGYNFAGF